MTVRLIDTPEDVRLEQLRDWARAVPGTTPIAKAHPGWRCDIAGVVRRLRIDPVAGTIRAVVTDGTGEMTALWRITEQSASFALPGKGVFASGLPAIHRDGGLVLEEPFCMRIPGPDEA
jgi:hypothetical protein